MGNTALHLVRWSVVLFVGALLLGFLRDSVAHPLIPDATGQIAKPQPIQEEYLNPYTPQAALPMLNSGIAENMQGWVRPSALSGVSAPARTGSGRRAKRRPATPGLLLPPAKNGDLSDTLVNVLVRLYLDAV
jgi:hypothetical protein